MKHGDSGYLLILMNESTSRMEWDRGGVVFFRAQIGVSGLLVYPQMTMLMGTMRMLHWMLEYPSFRQTLSPCWLVIHFDLMGIQEGI